MDRNSQIIGLRPVLPNVNNEVETLDVESFQNKVLRPILKFQHDILISIIDQYINDKKAKWVHWDVPARELFLKQSLSHDLKLRNVVIGVIVGLMQKEELYSYFQYENECRSRIIKMVVQRYLS